MAGYRLLPHTADVRLQVTASSMEELFRSALAGMSYLQKKDFCTREPRSFYAVEKIEVNSTDITNLLVDFLSEVLTLSHIKKVVYCEVNFLKLTDTDLTSTIKGDKVEYFDEDIKAVTYHEAEIKWDNDDQLQTIIIFDI